MLEQQLARVEAMKQEAPWTDYSNLSPIIGNLGGDGIGPLYCRRRPGGCWNSYSQTRWLQGRFSFAPLKV